MTTTTATVRTVTLEVTFAGVALTDVLSARGQVTADGGWPTCSVFVTAKPTTGNEDDGIQVIAGLDNVTTRFQGVVRTFRSSVFPKAIELSCVGTLAYANEWAPEEDIEFDDPDEGFPDGADDQTIVQWVLDHVPGITYIPGDIAGTGATLGAIAAPTPHRGSPESFDWKAGTTAWSYIQQLDRATLYRTYQDHLGAIRRVQMIGHPNLTPDFTLGNDDILAGATGSRDTERTRNNVVVRGHDYGDGTGAVEAVLSDPPIPGVPDRWEIFSSDMIESGVDPDGSWDGHSGLRADEIAAAILPDVNKEFVAATIPSWRDGTDGPGMTVLVDALDRLAIGEPMWLQDYAWSVGKDGWTAVYGLTGGGLPQDYEPPPV